ncbi:MAG: lysophospholipid acyltransferase family protein [Gemmatimonadaceae bacterium]
MNSNRSADLATSPDGALPVVPRAIRAVRSGAFIVVYFLYLSLVMGLGQRIVIWPLITLFPSRRRAVTRAWLRFHARATFALARSLASVRLTVRGAIGPEACVVAMNHQSVLDIPLGISLVPGPYPIIPTRARYGRGIPGISPLTRLARFPLVSQGRTATRQELLALRDAADQVARGEQSLLIFPEGHRTRDGSIGDFMKSGLKLILARARAPVYCVVADGMWHARTIADATFRFADTSVHAVVLGPFAPPEAAQLDAFIDELHDRMVAALAELRNTAS